jgi:hypothetical protein
VTLALLGILVSLEAEIGGILPLGDQHKYPPPSTSKVKVERNNNISITMAKRILLIGASKHIGFHVLEELALQPDKYTLFVLARSAAAAIAPFKGKESVTFIQGDAKDENVVGNAINSTMNGDVDFVVVSVGISPFFFGD